MAQEEGAGKGAAAEPQESQSPEARPQAAQMQPAAEASDLHQHVEKFKQVRASPGPRARFALHASHYMHVAPSWPALLIR